MELIYNKQQDNYFILKEIEQGHYDVIDSKGKIARYFINQKEADELQSAVEKGDQSLVNRLLTVQSVEWEDITRSCRGDIRPFREAVKRMSESVRRD
ncbi:MAG: hypothetical protein AABX39_01600 [Nanoarchaeota archaeon]